MAHPVRLGLVCALGAVIGLVCWIVPGQGRDEKKPTTKATDADSVVPMFSEIKATPKTELMIGKQKIKVQIEYAVQGTTIILLPAFVPMGSLEVLADKKARTCKDTERLIQADDPEGVQVRLKIVNLLADDVNKKAVKEKIKSVADEEDKIKDPKWVVATVNEQAFYATLCADNGNREVALSERTPVGPETVRSSGEIKFTIDRDALKEVETGVGHALTPTDVYVKIDGPMMATFKTKQYEADIILVERELTKLQTKLGSIAPSVKDKPEVFVQINTGGQVKDDRSAESLIAQYVVVDIRLSKTANAHIVRDWVERRLKDAVERFELRTKDEKKRIAILFDNQVAVSATLGEIKSLAKKSTKEREKAFNSAIEDWESRKKGEENEYKGALSVQGSYGPPLIATPIGGKLEAAWKKKQEEEIKKGKKRDLATLQRGLDEFKKHFNGSRPLVTGISFDQNAKGKMGIEKSITITESTIERGWTTHSYKPIRLSAASRLALNAEELARELGKAKLVMDEFEQATKRNKDVVDLNRRVAGVEKKLGEAETLFNKRLATLDKFKAEYEDLLGRSLEPGVVDYEKYEGATCIAYHPANESIIAVGKEDGQISIVQIPSGLVLKTFDQQHDKQVTALAFSPGGGYLLSGSKDKTVRLWSVKGKQHLQTLEGHTDAVKSVAFGDKDGDIAVSGGMDGTVRVWDLNTKKDEICCLEGHKGTVWSVAASVDGTIVSGGSDKTVRIWNYKKGKKEIHCLKGHTDKVYCVAISRDRPFVVSGSGDGTIRRWDLKTGKETTRLKGHTTGVLCICLSVDQKHLLSGSSDKSVRLWSLETKKELRRFTTHKSQVEQIVGSPFDRYACSLDKDKKVVMYRLHRVWR